jgi:hypothetical protein
MLPHLTHLEVFSYKYNCTDEVIEQLGLHCHNLKEIYVSRSSRVTNASVQHLLRLRKLEILVLNRTLIDYEHYSLLLSELPIQNIRFSPLYENILDDVADVKLHKISNVTGVVKDVNLVAQRCPNITHMDLHLAINSVDVSCLAALTTLRNLRIVGGDYATSNLNAVLTGIGPSLTDLTLDSMYNVNLHDIVTLSLLVISISVGLYVITITPKYIPSTPCYHISEM